jgi:hypothetical protein
MPDRQQHPLFQSLHTLAQALDDAVRRGALDLATATELLEHQAAARVELARLLAVLEEDRW